jgi:HD-GYP domain-containing protein (c-di-GMP phosphodiesterase class II)
MRLVHCENLTSGTELGEPIYGTAGQMLLAAGVKLTDRYISLLHKLNVPATYVCDAETADVQVPHAILPKTRAMARQSLANVFERLTPQITELQELAMPVLHENAGTERFAHAVRRAFGGSGGFKAIEQTLDTIVDDLRDHHALIGLNSIKSHDAYTFQHSIDVSIMGVLLARKAGWDAARVKSFGVGCMLHDLGKVLIPESILNFPGRLSDEDFKTMKGHPMFGYLMIKAIAPEMIGVIPQVAYQHHERQDGSGYPRGLKGNNVLGDNIAGRIHDFGSVAAVADVYDAMSSHRPYRKGWAPDKVVSTIAASAGDHLNREAVDLFVSIVSPYPVCSEVTVLNGAHAGASGIVAKVDPHNLRRPVVRILTGADGSRVSPFEIDLTVELDVEIRSAAAADPEVDSMGGRRQAPRGADPLSPDVLRALRKIREVHMN